MMNDVELNVTGGLPYSRRIRVTNGANIWSSVDDLEVRSQVRVSPDWRSTLKASLSSFITASIDGDDLILDLKLTGSQTRTLSGGHYDIVVTDKGSDDVRGIRVLKGILRLEPLTTGA
jgi:hypothetical protein